VYTFEDSWLIGNASEDSWLVGNTYGRCMHSRNAGLKGILAQKVYALMWGWTLCFCECMYMGIAY